jgi:GH24 family phage-related lysozyme (muramidase)
MKGVSRISGLINPKVGEVNFYEVAEFYKGTIVTESNQIKWILYEYQDGAWIALKGPLKTGKKVTFNFPQKWYGKKLLIEAYLDKPKGESLVGLIVSPVLGEKKILSAEILDESGKDITGNPKYGQSITLKVKTNNMLGDTLSLSLLNKDTNKDADVPNQNKPLWSGIAKVNDNAGVVEQRVMLSPAIRQLANKSITEGDIHQYELLVEGNGVIANTKDAKASNEIMLSPNPPTKPVTPPLVAPVSPAVTVPVQVQNGVGETQVVPVGGTNTAVVEEKSVENCEQKYCIKKGDKNELIRELNIRLAGFGGNVPTDEFTDRTEKMIKQFQRDYMKISETGRVCGNLLKAIDEFQGKYSVNIDQGRCKCEQCGGFGMSKYKDQKNDANIYEGQRKYEYPGMHRTLLWVQRAIQFYLATLEKKRNLKVKFIYSGYRCWIRNAQSRSKTTNHMGKASDIHIMGGKNDDYEENANEVRDILVKYSGAKYRWDIDNVIALEPDYRNGTAKEHKASDWVHYDVRTFDLKYLEDKYFVKNNAAVNGKSILALAAELGFQKTCVCNGTGNNSVKDLPQDPKTETGRVDPKTLKTSPKGIEFIKAYEKFEPYPYDDAEGYCTIGYGHLIKYSRCNGTESTEFLKGISKNRAMELFNQRLVTFENGLRRSIKVKLYQHEFDALVSLLFNAGESFLDNGGANKGNTQIKIKINKGNYAAGADEMRDVNNGGLAGLVKRRKAEINMFKNKVYEMHK